MKKLICLIITLTALLGTFQMSVSAEEYVTVVVDGAVLHTDQPAEIINGRTMVPLRAIFEALGAYVEWIEDGQYIYSRRDNIISIMQIGNTNMMIQNGGEPKTIYLDSPPLMKNDRTLVPARAVAEAYDCNVKWDENTQTVHIRSNYLLLAKKSSEIVEGSVYNDNVYFKLNTEPNIYVYNGNTTTAFSAGGTVSAIRIFGKYIYYINKSNQTVCRINQDTDKREILGNAYSNIKAYYIYGQTILIVGTDNDGVDGLYSYDIITNKTDVVIQFSSETDIQTPEFTDIIRCDRFAVVAHRNIINDEDRTFQIVVVDIYNQAIKKVFYENYTFEEPENDNAFIDSDYKLAKNGMKIIDEIAYLEIDPPGFNERLYIKVPIGDGKGNEITESEYNSADYNAVNNQDTWSCYESNIGNSHNIYGVTGDIKEVLYTSSNILKVIDSNGVYDDGIIAFDEENHNNYYTIYNICVMDKYGSNLKKIATYSADQGVSLSSSGTSSVSSNSNSFSNSGNNVNNPGGATIEAAKKCSLCNESGQMKCNMCGGDGMMPSLVQFGLGGSLSQNGTTEEPCRYCSGGTKQCLACGGDGEIQ